jgi:uncharacterized membrane protein YkoI
MKHLATTLLIALLAAATVAPTAAAQGQDRERRGNRDDNRDDRGSREDRGNRDRNENRGGGMSLDQAVAMVERRFKAKVVRTETRQDGDRKVYVLRLLNDEGRVWSVRVDASSGSVQ